MLKDVHRYIIIYIISISLSIYVSRTVLDDNNLLEYHLKVAFVYSSIIFIFSFYYNFTNMIDLCWTTLGFHLIGSNLKFLWIKSFIENNIDTEALMIFNITILTLYSIRMTVGYLVRGFHGIKKENEDFRYKEFENNLNDYPKIVYWVFNYIGLHIIPISILAISHLPAIASIEYLANYNKAKNIKLSYLGAFICCFALFLETIADEQLEIFRQKKKYKKTDKKVMNTGLWNYIRHPNYLGELLFHWGIFITYYGITGLAEIYLLGPVLMTATFIFYSIPAMNRLLLLKYKKEYLDYSEKTYRLIPYIY